MLEVKENENMLEDEINIEQMETDKKEDNFNKKDKIIYILKGISSILSSIIHNIGYISIWVLGYTTIYLISFRRHYNQNIDFSQSYCLIPLMNLVFGLTAPIGGILKDKYGGRTTIFFSNLIICISFIIMYFSRSIYFDYFLMCLNGFGIAVGYNITKKNACAFFMNRKALICAIINLFSNAFSFCLIFYFEVFILNFDIEYPSIDKIYYREKIFLNYQRIFIFEIVLTIFTCLITLLLYFKNDVNETIKFGFNEKTNTDNNKSTNNNEIEKIEKNKKKISKNVKIKNAIKNNRTIKLIIMVFLFYPMINFINSVMRMDMHFYFIFGALYNAAGCISSLIFGLIGDLVQFRILFVILAALLSLTSFIYVKYFGGEFILFPIIVFVSLIDNGFNIIFDSHIMKVYGMDNYIEIWGIIRGSGRISEIFGIIFYFILESNSYVYKIIYGFTGVLSLISLGLGLFETEDKFNYDN